MPVEPDSGDVRDLWSSQPVQPVRPSPEELRLKSERMEASMKRCFWIAAATMIGAAALWVGILYAFPGFVQRLGATLTLAAYLYCGWRLAQQRPANDPAAPTSAGYRAQLERQLEFSRTGWRRFILPFLPGPALSMVGLLLPIVGPWKAAAFALAVVLPVQILTVPLFRRRVRFLERELRELDALTS